MNAREYEGIERIFFDSGMVLIRPRSGSWFYPEAYARYCASKSLGLWSPRLAANQKKALRFLDDNHRVATEEEEYAQFLEFYGILFAGIRGKDGGELAELCARATVYDRGKYLFYPDVRESTARLSARFSLGIITDAWPSVASVYREAGLLNAFDPFVISSVHGTTKSGYELFRIALDRASASPAECLFVDDSAGNCERARELGMKAVILNRNKFGFPAKGLARVSNLASLERLLAGD